MSERRRYRDCACRQETACGLHKTTVAAADARALRSLARWMEKHSKHAGNGIGTFSMVCMSPYCKDVKPFKLPARYRAKGKGGRG